MAKEMEVSVSRLRRFSFSLLLSPVPRIFPPMLSLTFLGTGAACPTIERNVASLAVQREGETMLFDCGEGTQRQMMRYGVSFAFRDIFFTHWHSDHLLGVIGLLRTMGLLNIFGGQERRDRDAVAGVWDGVRRDDPRRDL